MRSGAQAKPSLQGDLHAKLTLDDWGLRYRSPKDARKGSFDFDRVVDAANANLTKTDWREYLPEELAKQAIANRNRLTSEMVRKYYENHRDYSVLESRRMLLEPNVVNAVAKLSPLSDDVVPRWRWTPNLIYLADSISDGTRETPYAIIGSDNQKDGKGNDLIGETSHPWRLAGLAVAAKAGDNITITYYFRQE